MARKFKGARTEKRFIAARGQWRVRVWHPDKMKHDRWFVLEKDADEHVVLYENKFKSAGQVTFDRAIASYERERLGLRDAEEGSIVETTRRLRALYLPVLKLKVAGFTEKKLKECYYGREEAGVLVFHGLANRPTLRKKGDPATWKKCEFSCGCPGEGAPLAVDSHRNYLAEGKTFLRWCQRKEYLGELELDEVSGVGNRNPGGLGQNRLAKKELRALYRKAMELALKGDERAVAVLFALLYGMRASEIVSRQVRHVDEETWTIEVDPDAAKTDASDRDNVIPQVLRPIIRALIKGKGQDELLFTTAAGGEHWRDWPNESLERICILARVPVVNVHSLRGAHADLAKAAGETAEAVAAQLGQVDTRTGDRSYTSEIGRRGARRAKQGRVLEVLEGGKKKAGGAG